MQINTPPGSQPPQYQPPQQDPPPPYGQQGPPPHNQIQFDPRDVEENRAVAALAYVWILFLIPMLARPQSRFARAHTNQGIILFIATLVFWVASLVLSWVPLINIMVWLGSGLFTLLYLIVAIYQIVICLQGRFKEIPLIGGMLVLK